MLFASGKSFHLPLVTVCSQRGWAKIDFSLPLKKPVFYFFHWRHWIQGNICAHPALLLRKDFLKNYFSRFPAFLPPMAQELMTSPSSHTATAGPDLIRQKILKKILAELENQAWPGVKLPGMLHKTMLQKLLLPQSTWCCHLCAARSPATRDCHRSQCKCCLLHWECNLAATACRKPSQMPLALLSLEKTDA